MGILGKVLGWEKPRQFYDVVATYTSGTYGTVANVASPDMKSALRDAAYWLPEHSHIVAVTVKLRRKDHKNEPGATKAANERGAPHEEHEDKRV